MCGSLKDFDLRARGVVNLVETWKAKHAAVRHVWKVEDLIGEWLGLAAAAGELFAYYREHAQFPNSTAAFSYFVELLAESVRCGCELENVASMFEAENYQVAGADSLRRDIERLQRIIDEDRFATLAAFDSGALDDWD